MCILDPWEELRLAIMEFHMSILSSAPARPVGFPGFSGVKAVLQDLLQRYTESQSRRREIYQVSRELQAYTDRQLHDLGLDRSDIDAVARGTYSRA
jgi:uncharacterized protein YjiS (DUF1127 family)